MTAGVHRARRSRTEEIWWVVAVIALAVVASSSIFSSRSTGVASVAPDQSTLTSLRSAPSTFRSIRHSLPVRLEIPTIGVVTSVGVVGLQRDHQVVVPNNVHTVSWYRYGPTPGEVGSAVILGHVDSFTGPGVFFSLKTLKIGAPIKVTLADGIITYFAVLKVKTYSKSSFPDRLIYGPHGTRLLNLVTCGGVFDHATGHYQSNVVVFSKLMRVTPAPKK